MRKLRILGWLMTVGLTCFAAWSCTPTMPSINFNNSNNATNNSGGTGSATPTPVAGGGELPAGSIIRIGLFGQSPAPGPPNGARQIVVGNTGFITATPKDANGNDIPASIHGPNIAWSVTHGGGNVQINVPSEPFNRDVKCLQPGVFGLSAQVKNVTGTADFECVPRASSTTCGTCAVNGGSSGSW